MANVAVSSPRHSLHISLTATRYITDLPEMIFQLKYSPKGLFRKTGVPEPSPLVRSLFSRSEHSDKMSFT